MGDLHNTRRQPQPYRSGRQERLPPHSEIAEQGVLGCIMLSPQTCMAEATERLCANPNLFYDMRHREIYTTLLAMFTEAKPIDVITLEERLKERGQLDQAGGLPYVASLPDIVPSSANLSYYADIMREKYLLRRMIQQCTDTIGSIYEGGKAFDAMLDEYERGILSVRTDLEKSLHNGYISVAEVLGQLDNDYSAALLLKEKWRPGIPTGFPDLDHLIGGLRSPDVFIIAARTSVGKTSLSMNIAEHVVFNENKTVLIFSLEMSGKQLLHRLACSMSRTDGSSLLRGSFSDDSMKRLSDAAAKIQNAERRLIICDQGGLSVHELSARARRLKIERNVNLIIVDYLQLLSAGKKCNNRYEEVTAISNAVKAMAKELNVPIILVSQLSRAHVKESHIPRMSDLRDSGRVEEDADIVGLLYPEEEGSSDVILNIPKHRNGPTGLIHLTWMKEWIRFESAAKIDAEDIPPQKTSTPYRDD